ncbi:cytochrome P450 [Phreatobacter oligotrophus]|uniref:Cytochrome P450 n=1 Tax=Phreatobacter oligotrophus TaxID=1122261 RepID=A0A2T4Z5K8_9HYPH|nr:cytochrome P450 [Phreatobacter oligotrophus]PTM57174.1 cytochrome P450 [Phreatobacter oligotrophus]
MTAADGALFTPEVLSHPVEPLGLLRFLRRLVDNPLATWPQAVFEEKTLEVPFGKRGLLFVMDPPLVDEVLVGIAAAFPKAPIIRRTIGPAVGDDSIFTAEGAAWRWQRRAASPPFRHGTILSFLPAFTASAITTVDRLGASSGDTVDMAEAMMETTFDVIVETMLSGRTRFDTKRFGEEISRYFDTVGWIAAYTTLRLPDWLPYPGRRRAMAGNRFLRAEMARVIAERRIAPSPVPDLLDALIAATDPEDGRAMTDAELADNLLTFVVAGHETTALALTWALWLIGHAPAVEARLLDEVERVVGAGPVEAAHIEGLAYTKQVIQEAMRLYPPAPIIPRIAAEDVTLGDRQLAKGTPVYIPVYAVHRHKLIWDHPAAFDPDRFAPEKARQLHRGAYLPFGAGPRICIGAAFAQIEAVAILATLIRSLRFVPLPGHRPMPTTRLTLRPEGGMPMRVERR